MSTETIQAALETTDRPARQQPREREFEEFFQQTGQVQSDEPLSLRAWLNLAEAWKITRTLRACGGNRSAAARALGIGRRTLYAKMEKLQITPSWALGRGPASGTDPR